VPNFRLAVVTLAAFTFSIGGSSVHAQSARLVAGADAYVSRLLEDDQWEIGNAGVVARFGFDRERNFVLVDVHGTGSSVRWNTTAAPDSYVTIAGKRESVGARSWQPDGVDASPHGSGVELTFRFHSTQAGARIARHYTCYPTAPVIETWTTIEPLDARRPIKVSNLNGFELQLRGGPIRWVTGLKSADGPFTLTSTRPEDGERFEIGATGRATETALPWFMIEWPSDEFFAGLLWPGSWQLDVVRAGDEMHATLGLPNVETTASGPVETPHAYFGVTGGSVKQASEATRGFVAAALRGDRPYTPLVTQNTWFAYGTEVDQETMVAEIQSAAALGVELFVLDAGWYRGGTDVDDFTSGLGLWQADTRRFPSGLGALSARAHDLGIEFGIWVEPERVDIGTVGKPGLARERWLATVDGRYDPAVPPSKVRAAQVCLADSEARAWVLGKLVALIEEVHPDYLKWDNNFWINCNRSGHGHGAADGNFAHVLGLRDVLAQLRARFPDLMIENCSGGGNRLEPGMLALTDTAWMDDQTAPSSRVRHNFEGLSVVLPPASLLSFVVPSEWGGGDSNEDLPLSFRSRMPGILGSTWRAQDLSEGQAAQIQREIEIYKSIRDVLVDSSAQLLTAQVAQTPAAAWDVIQEISAGRGDAVIFAFDNPGADPHVRIRPVDLRPDGIYAVSSVDRGYVGEVLGSDLMDAGIEVNSSPVTRAHVLRLTLLGFGFGFGSGDR
jgi:alpha-galactosidase